MDNFTIKFLAKQVKEYGLNTLVVKDAGDYNGKPVFNETTAPVGKYPLIFNGYEELFAVGALAGVGVEFA